MSFLYCIVMMGYLRLLKTITRHLVFHANEIWKFLINERSFVTFLAINFKYSISLNCSHYSAFESGCHWRKVERGWRQNFITACKGVWGKRKNGILQINQKLKNWILKAEVVVSLWSWLCQYCKKGDFFLPEFSICLCISSSVAIQMIKICTENTSEGGREKRGRREERNRPRKEAHNDHMI